MFKMVMIRKKLKTGLLALVVVGGSMMSSGCFFPGYWENPWGDYYSPHGINRRYHRRPHRNFYDNYPFLYKKEPIK